MNKFVLKTSEFNKVFNFGESNVVKVDYFKIENGRVYLKFLSATNKEILLDVTDMIKSILDDEEEVNYENIQKIFKYLPSKTRVKKDKDENAYFDKYLMYKILYRACEKSKKAQKKLYVIKGQN